MDRKTHPQFVPNDTAGTREDTAVLLVGTAKEHGLPQRDIASTHGGYWITSRLADLVFEEGEEIPEDDGADASDEGQDTAESESTKKASGNRAAKNKKE
jgi:hypothetical protein